MISSLVLLFVLLCPAGLPLRVPLPDPVRLCGIELRPVCVHDGTVLSAAMGLDDKRSLALRVRGGSGNEEVGTMIPRQVSSRVVMLPYDAEGLQEALDLVEHRGAEGGSLTGGTEAGAGCEQPEEKVHDKEILVGTALPDERRVWGTRHDGFSSLTIRGRGLLLRMEDSVSLRGPIDLLPSSDGTMLRWKWGCAFSFSLQQGAALDIAGGPWKMRRCVLRAADMPVLRAFSSAIVSLDDCFVGGFSPDVSFEDGQERNDASAIGDGNNCRCTKAMQVEANASVTASDCTLQYCGAWSCATVLVGGAARLQLAKCFLYQNLGCGISIHEAADVEARQCSIMELGGSCFRAVLAHDATLRLFNLTILGDKWHDQARPGTLEEEGELVLKTKRRRIASRSGRETLGEVHDGIDAAGPQTVEVWQALTYELAANSSQVIDTLETYCNATGAVCRRARTGRQALASPRFSIDDAAVANLSGPELLDYRVGREEGPDWEDLPPLLLADFSHLAEDSATATLCVYVHVEPLFMSALRDSSMIADGGALLIEHSDRFLSRRRFGGDTARVVTWLAALEAYAAAGTRTPLRVKMIFDMLEEAHSSLLGKRLVSLSGKGGDGFLSSVDYVCVMHGEWLTPWRPCLVTAFRGLSTHFLSVNAPWGEGGDLHSGYFGGAVREPFADLLAVLACLVSANASAAVPWLADEWAAELTREELEMVSGVTFFDEGGRLPPGWEATPQAVNSRACANSSGAEAGKEEVDLEQRDECLVRLGWSWFRPSVTVHGISGGWTDPGCRTVIPGKLEAKLSVRFPSPLSAAEVICRLQAQVDSASQVSVLSARSLKLATNNNVEIQTQYSWESWTSTPSSPFYQAAARAMEEVYGCEPDFIRDGGSMHVPRLFEEACRNSQVGVLSLSFRDASRYSDDSVEEMSQYMLLGVKTVVTLLEELAHA